MIPPPANLQYSGPVEVHGRTGLRQRLRIFLLRYDDQQPGHDCGQYPSEGAGGSVEDFMMPENTQVQLTIGREVDAKATFTWKARALCRPSRFRSPLIRFKSKPTAKMWYWKLPKRHCGQSSSSGQAVQASPGPLPPASSAPTMASKSDAASALSSNAPYLEHKASEQYQPSDFAKPGTLTYTVSLTPTDQVIWGYGWCATTQDILNTDLKSIKFKVYAGWQGCSCIGHASRQHAVQRTTVSNNLYCARATGQQAHTILSPLPPSQERSTMARLITPREITCSITR